jgi:hypothetical protein
VLSPIRLLDAEIGQRIDAGNGTQENVAATAAVTAVGTAQRHKFLAPETAAPPATIAGLHPQARLIDEFHVSTRRASRR